MERHNRKAEHAVIKKVDKKGNTKKLLQKDMRFYSQLSTPKKTGM